jgi:hypothetical protein
MERSEMQAGRVLTVLPPPIFSGSPIFRVSIFVVRRHP